MTNEQLYPLVTSSINARLYKRLNVKKKEIEEDKGLYSV